MDKNLQNAFSAALAFARDEYCAAVEERAQPDELDEIFISSIIKSLARSGYYIDVTMADQKLAARYPLSYDMNTNRLTFFVLGLALAAVMAFVL